MSVAGAGGGGPAGLPHLGAGFVGALYKRQSFARGANLIARMFLPPKM